MQTTTVNNNGIEMIRAKRTGERDLQFRGELLSETSDREFKGDGADQDSHQWDITRVYRTESGKYVVHVSHVSMYPGHDWQKASVVATLADVEALLTQDGEDYSGSVREALGHLGIDAVDVI